MEGRRTGGGLPASHPDGDRAPSAAKEGRKNNAQGKPAPARLSPSGKGFFQRKCPLWLRRRRAAHSPEGQAAARSRLCMEAAHESPIQAVRKPSPGGWPSAEAPAGGETGPSLLRKLLCLKAASSRLKRPPPRGPEASLLYGASPRCGPVAALSRAADPQGESPLRWRPATEPQAPSAAAPQQGGPGRRRRMKPWQMFREAVASRAKKRPVLSGPGQQGREDLTDLGRPAEPGRSPSLARAEGVSGEPPGSLEAGEAGKLLSARPLNVGDTQGAQEGSGGHGSSRHSPEICRVVGDRREAGSRADPLRSPTPEKSQSQMAKDIPEWERLQAWAYALSGRDRAEVAEAAREGQASQQMEGGCPLWAEEEEEEEEPALAELAENPGGQGMLMGIRDFGWLNRELLGGPTSSRKAEAAAEKAHRAPHPEEEASRPGAPGGRSWWKSQGSQSLGTERISTGASFRTSSGREEGCGAALPLQGVSGASPHPGLPREGGLLIPWRVSSPPSVPHGAREPGLPEGLLSPAPGHSLALSENREKEEQGEQQASPEGKPLRPSTATERRPAEPQPEALGAEAKLDTHALRLAAVEIVGAAIDAAAAQLARKEEQELAALGLSKGCP
nr:dapper homolog 3-like [Pogona vitticeps]